MININDFKIDHDLETIISNNSIYYAPNGVGKSSICRAIKSKFTNTVELLSYSDQHESYFAYKEDSKEILISPQILKFNKLKEENNELIENLKLKKYNTKFNKSNIIKENEFKNILIEDYLENKDIILLEKKEFDQIFEIFNWETVDKEKVGKYLFENLTKINNINNNIIENKELLVLKFLEDYDFGNSLNENNCPICGSENKRKKIIEKLEDLLQKYNKELHFLANEINIKYQNVEKLVNYYKNNKWKVLSFIVFNGLYENQQEMKKNKDKYEKNKILMEEIQKERSSYSDSIKKASKDLEIILSEIIGENVFKSEISDNNLKITLPRNVANFSTGEKNLMSIVARILNFKFNLEIEYLVLDDPFTSYDISNRHLIMKILKDTIEYFNHNDIDKKIIIFTHSFHILKELNIKKVINNFFCIDYKIFDERKIIKLDSFFLKTNFRDELIKDCKIFKFLIYGDKSAVNNFFHWNYDNEEDSYRDYDQKRISPKNLIDYFENFDKNLFDEQLFFTNYKDKIKLLISIRVWIEYKIWSSLNDELKLKWNDLNKKTIGNKIDFCEKNIDFFKDIYPNLEKNLPNIFEKIHVLNSEKHIFEDFLIDELFLYSFALNTHYFIKLIENLQNAFSKKM
ncbi:hypothetical protein ESOMN_v1c05920 [Williamsoniiplasma somnilux]|uniref:Nuclease SbcCD subunit C n=1 Tax=Williamsoniiplasma somnilux TaxID=215578 RepID=A0A2K8NZ16_9MOLU|nr:hypothetical protein [Williamsoniiplasma somnilux]ATZ18974.1 hypothetical protein ESOMN_v1c05920 [Williamsoniiplasma somnilux]